MPDLSKNKDKRVWRLAADVVIRPVAEMPPETVEQAMRDKKNPENYFGIERKRSRAPAKIVNRDVVDVLRAFGGKGASYEEVLERFLEERNLERAELHPGMHAMVRTFISSNFLVEGRREDESGSEEVAPSFREGDTWLDYRIIKNVHVIIDTEIYQVEHVPSGVIRALKITQPTFPRAEMKTKIFERLEHEFGTIERLDHPSIVRIHDHGVHEGRMYGILDWIDGRSVYSYAYESDGDAPNDALILQLSSECLEALDAVHAAGYLHGDVHTRNFLVKNGHVCLIDFGLSRPIAVDGADERNYVEGGVVRFMPPEYVAHKFENRKGLWGSVAGEIYSCGVMIFSLFTKTYPYKWSFYREDFMRSILNDPPPGFEECERDPWPELEAVLMKALEKEPGNRFRTAGEFAAALARLHPPPS
jgi:serine/threonine-protein kinase